LFALRVEFDIARCVADFYWSLAGQDPRHGRVEAGGAAFLCELTQQDGDRVETRHSADNLGVLRLLNRALTEYPTSTRAVSVHALVPRPGGGMRADDLIKAAPDLALTTLLREELLSMANAVRERHEAERTAPSVLKREWKREQARRQLEERAAAYRAEKAALEARRREQAEARARAEAAAGGGGTEAKSRLAKAAPTPAAPAVPAATRQPVPPVVVRLEMPALEGLGPAGEVLRDLAGLRLREAGALWWVSNQSDDLLCLPACRVRRLEYQVRTALRALGPLQGRALLSDEVGLGKTIEAGLIAKELCTRGMVRRLLVLTLPSLVDQWEEELADKFDLVAATTNHAAFAADPARVWAEAPLIVASLHTFKQPAQLAEAAKVAWDLVIVDEAHHLRRRESVAWQAVNAIKRQHMLLLTATPVQNSLEELYNLVTLLKPGQLPAPKEFRARFLDPKQPRQPREPEELRRLLGQVMIRNTRANSGLELPPRRAETVLFAPGPAEGAWWAEWEAELRVALAALPASQASLWGRLLLRALGSSPAAWRAALRKFPDQAAAARWRAAAEARAGGEGAWGQKTRLLAPLARLAGGVVIFTEFLETQAALAESLRADGAPVWVINGSTPAPERQPITERFQREGGALLLTHSGTEGRNLQFCATLANFDLPWNPMEIEQRIGRLHRLGQTRPVRICNFVQAGTLQEHLLGVLQEKLNLFELVVGETGLVLGERYSGDEFAEEIFSRWRDHEGRVGEAVAALGEELAAARAAYAEVKALDETLFAKDYESS
jgi:superfamily II DNA or RNA helicase